MRSSLAHPGRWLWLLLLVPAAIGLTRLHLDIEVFDLLPDDVPAVYGLKLYQQHFANARELILTLRAPDAEQAEQLARTVAATLRADSNLVDSVTWEPPWMEHPEQFAELIASIWFNQPPERLMELAQRLEPSRLPALLDNTREQLASSLSPGEIAQLSYDPFGFTRLPEEVAGTAPSMEQGQETFVSADGKFRILFIKSARDLPTFRDCEEWLGVVRQRVNRSLAQDKSAAGPVSVGYTGRPAFVAEIARGMQHDITLSVAGTAIIIALLFWLAHRRIKPMLWLLTLLALILATTLALGGLIYGWINVVSMGFAAILLGLAVDYAVVHYQEALAHPGLTIPQIRAAIAPSIFWAAVTTISAFLVLNFGGLPGLGQLGTLVGLGVALAATIMIFEFLPPLFPERRSRVGLTGPAGRTGVADVEPSRSRPGAASEHRQPRSRLVFGMTLVVLIACAAILLAGLPRVDTTADALRPRRSPAYETMETIQKQMTRQNQPLWVVIRGHTEQEVADRLRVVHGVLQTAVSNQLISKFALPAALWPNPANQAGNRSTAVKLVAERAAFHQAALTNGFAESSLGLADRVLDAFQQAAGASGTFWPRNNVSQWIFEKFAARTPTNYLAVGFVSPNTNTVREFPRLQAQLPPAGVWLSGWELLGHAIYSRVQGNFWKVLGPMVVLVSLSLWLAFRRAPEILLSLAVLLMSGLVLLAVMRLAGWSWNLLNLMAVPLVLGTGVDYSIFMQLALRRHYGDLRMGYQSVGRALLLCGGTAVAGFGSLGLSSNVGMASLGRICAVGIGSNMLIAIFLLPVWWKLSAGRAVARDLGSPVADEVTSPGSRDAVAGTEAGLVASSATVSGMGPSPLYRGELWRLGMFLVRILPSPCIHLIADACTWSYWHCVRNRREIVIQNLLPAAQEPKIAQQTAFRLYRNFGHKIADLFRYEAGLPIAHLFGTSSGWEVFETFRAQKRGVLLLTPHLGNWEFGGPWLTGKGVPLQVITLAEPGRDFTRLRQESRARWNIETLVIGEDPFAFLEIIRRLESGATIALLMDRPPATSSVAIKLFGRPFSASIAATELARASGCALLPVYIPRVGSLYEAHILPEITYDRARLRDRAARQELTQRIMGVFEPIIQKHLDQWYHFVPVWKDGC
jgi:uncharacterized protein